MVSSASASAPKTTRRVIETLFMQTSSSLKSLSERLHLQHCRCMKRGRDREIVSAANLAMNRNDVNVTFQGKLFFKPGFDPGDAVGFDLDLLLKIFIAGLAQIDCVFAGREVVDCRRRRAIRLRQAGGAFDGRNQGDTGAVRQRLDIEAAGAGL